MQKPNKRPIAAPNTGRPLSVSLPRPWSLPLSNTLGWGGAPKWDKGFWPMGIKTVSFAACWADFVPKYFKLYEYTGEPIAHFLITPIPKPKMMADGDMKWIHQKVNTTQVYECLLLQIGPFSACVVTKILQLVTFIVLGRTIPYYLREGNSGRIWIKRLREMVFYTFRCCFLFMQRVAHQKPSCDVL